MLKKSTFTTIFAVLFFSMSGSVSADDQRKNLIDQHQAQIDTELENSYPIFCRKGGGMRMRIEPYEGYKINDENWTASQINIYFERSKRKFEFGKDTLKPGECAYQNRPILDSEPREMVFFTPTIMGAEFPIGGTGETKFIYRGSTRYEFGKQAARFVNTLNSEEYFTVEAAKHRRVKSTYYITRIP